MLFFQAGMSAAAPIAPLNTTPTPMAAFGMAQAMPMQPLSCTSMIAGGSTMVPSIAPMSTGIYNLSFVIIKYLVLLLHDMIHYLLHFLSGTGVVSTPPVVGLPLVSATTASTLVNGVIAQTPVSTSTPLSTTARPPSIDRVGSVDSQHSQHSVGSPQSVEWAVPHQTKLKYTQLFNTWDRARSGFLSGPQARNIMVQSQLPQQVLAQIWYNNISANIKQ